MAVEERFIVVLTYENKTDSLYNVPIARYSYISLLSDVYKLFNIAASFVSFVTGSGMSVENDDDLMLAFELYKHSHKLPLTVHVKGVPLNTEMSDVDDDDDDVCIIGESSDTGEGSNLGEGGNTVEDINLDDALGRKTPPLNRDVSTRGRGRSVPLRGKGGRSSFTRGRGIRQESVSESGQLGGGANESPQIDSESDVSFNESEVGDDLPEEVIFDNEISTEESDGLSGYASDNDKEVEDSENESYDPNNRKKKYIDPYHGMYDHPFQHNEGEEILFKEGQVFKDIVTLRNAMRDYAIKGGYDITRVKNDSTRLTAKCSSTGCPWRFHASVLSDQVTFMVKTLHDEHTCIRPLRNENLNSNTKWIVEKLRGKLRADPDMSYELMQHELMGKWGVEVPVWQLYRAKCKARDENMGMHCESFQKLKKYVHYLQTYNPGTVVKIQPAPRVNEDDPFVFQRIWIMFDAIKSGFENGCRPFIGLDGCHLKGPYGGIFLVAVILDGNRGVLPLAFSIVEAECGDSWTFFLENLYSCIGGGTDARPLTIMSDRQKV